MTMTTVTLVTATIFNDRGESESASTYWDEANETLDDAKKEVLEIARERFHDEAGYNDPRGVIYNVNHIKVPEIPSSTVETEPVIEPVTL